MVAALIRMAFYPKMLTRRSAVHKIWYESDRDRDATPSAAVRASNAMMLLILIGLITAPLWNLIPWSLTPRGSSLGSIRYAAAILVCHVSLVLWPCAYFLLRGLVRQPRWIERVKTAALLAVCLWLAWGGAREVIWFWGDIFGWLTP